MTISMVAAVRSNDMLFSADSRRARPRAPGALLPPLLHRCKKCQVYVLEQDRAGHLARCLDVPLFFDAVQASQIR